jgi:hypothetical protein
MLDNTLHQYQLFNGVTLSNDGRSFEINMTQTRHHLWLLQHFGHLEIKTLDLKYQINNGIRQRKNTQHPIRNLQKKFKNTFELVTYLGRLPYDILRIKIEFINGWRIEDLPYMSFRIITNDLPDRNVLLAHFFQIAAISKFDLNELQNGKAYLIDNTAHGQVLREFEWSEYPDETDIPF